MLHITNSVPDTNSESFKLRHTLSKENITVNFKGSFVVPNAMLETLCNRKHSSLDSLAHES